MSIFLSNQTQNQIRESIIDLYVSGIYRTINVLEIEFYPSWNILESHFFIAEKIVCCFAGVNDDD